MSSRIEQIIEEIEEYIEGCKYATLSNKNIVVNKEELLELIEELRSKTPDEIKRYQKIISNRDAIIADAQERADQIIAQAQIKQNEMVSDHEITRLATAQGNEIVAVATSQAQDIVNKATGEANEVKVAGRQWVVDLLDQYRNEVAQSIETANSRYQILRANIEAQNRALSENFQAMSTNLTENMQAMTQNLSENFAGLMSTVGECGTSLETANNEGYGSLMSGMQQYLDVFNSACAQMNGQPSVEAQMDTDPAAGADDLDLSEQ